MLNSNVNGLDWTRKTLLIIEIDQSNTTLRLHASIL